MTTSSSPATVAVVAAAVVAEALVPERARVAVAELRLAALVAPPQVRVARPAAVSFPRMAASRTPVMAVRARATESGKELTELR
jgi:hypothetical protein